MSFYVYHATSIENYRSILNDGVIKDNFGVYFANKQDYAQAFCEMRSVFSLGDEFGVIKIRKDNLRKVYKNKFLLSHDHNPAFYPKDLRAYVCWQDVNLWDVDAICGTFRSIKRVS
jgi:hypothetical protein